MTFRIWQPVVYRIPVQFSVANHDQNTSFIGLSSHSVFTVALPKALCAQSLVTVVTGCILDMQVTKEQG